MNNKAQYITDKNAGKIGIMAILIIIMTVVIVSVVIFVYFTNYNKMDTSRVNAINSGRGSLKTGTASIDQWGAAKPMAPAK